jgi:hypothetical protein
MASELHLNFLAAKGAIPPFEVFRRLRPDGEKIPRGEELVGSRLPREPVGAHDWQQYLVSFKPREEFERFLITPGGFVHLTLRAMVAGLTSRCAELGPSLDWRVASDGFTTDVIFPVGAHPEGEEEVILQPYFLSATRQYGFLVDFHFRLADGIPFSRRVQQLSLSLDERFRRNLDYYADRLAKIEGFISNRWGQITPILLPGARTSLAFSADLTPLSCQNLQPKSYIVGSGRNQREHPGQFTGVKEVGPWKPITKCPPLLFIFREQDIEPARRLARALRGREPGIPFIGFERLFRIPLEVSANPVVIADFSQAEMERALSFAVGSEGPTHIPVLVMPKGEDAYVVD